MPDGGYQATPDGPAFGSLLHTVSFNLGVLCNSISRLADQYDLDLHQDSSTLQQENQQLVLELDYLCRLLSNGSAAELAIRPLNDAGGDEVSFGSNWSGKGQGEAYDPTVASKMVRMSSIHSRFGSRQTDVTEIAGSEMWDGDVPKLNSLGSFNSMASSEVNSELSSVGIWGIKMWDIWNEAPEGREEYVQKGDRRLRRMMAHTSLHDPGDVGTRKFQTRHNCARLIARPSSMRRLLWDVGGMVLIGYDLITIPLQCFNIPANIFSTVMAWITLLFWTFDIPMTFFVGFHKEGVVEMRAMKIAKHYFQSWFLFDLLVVGSDWWVTLWGFLQPSPEDGVEGVDSGDDTTTAGERVGLIRLGKTARFLRVLRLLRLLKLHGMIADIFERIQSEFTRIMLGIFNLIVFIMLINHVIACLFYGIGTLDDDWKVTWVKENDLPAAALEYQYTTALHWSLTQFTPASMEVVPTNSWERTYTVCTLLFAMVTFSSFVSSITNAMTQLRNLDSGRIAQYATLRRYLKENRVHAGLNNQIWGWLQHTTDTARHRLHEEEVSLLALLPKSLQFELQQEIYKPLLCVHPFFDKFFDAIQANRKMFACLAEVTLTIGQELFCSGERAARMSFVINGTLSYTMGLHSLDCIAKIREGQWVCEPVLWIEWKHCGQLTALTHCEFIAINARPFQELMQRDLVEAWQAAVYAKLYTKYITDHRVNINDVWTDWDVLQELTTRVFTNPENSDSVNRLTRTTEIRKSEELQDGAFSLDERRRQFNSARTSLVPEEVLRQSRLSVGTDAAPSNARGSLPSAVPGRVSITSQVSAAPAAAWNPAARLAGKFHLGRHPAGAEAEVLSANQQFDDTLRTSASHGRMPKSLPPRGAINRRAPRLPGDGAMPLPGDSEATMADLQKQGPGRDLVASEEDGNSNATGTSRATEKSVGKSKQERISVTIMNDFADSLADFTTRPPRDLTYPNFVTEASPRPFLKRLGTNQSLSSTASSALSSFQKVIKPSSKAQPASTEL